MDNPASLTAVDAAQSIIAGRLSSVDMVQSCLDRIEETDGQIKAWAHIDREHALEQARAMDTIRKNGRPVGALHGVPVGLKDIIDTRDMPTQRGTPIFEGRQSEDNAAIVDRLIDAGAVILGKTVTTELAFLHASQTRNPHNVDHTPGGSSSGSAAAVAAYQVPLAIGTQTNGSVIRPASFCGIYGFKPTRGVVSRRGVLQTSKSLDQIGAFGRSLEDVALLADVISGYDPSDSVSYPRPRPKMLAGARSKVPIEPNFAVIDLPFADLLESDAADGLEEAIAALGGQVDRLPAPPAFPGLVNVQKTIHEYEIVLHLDQVLSENWDLVSSTLQPAIVRGRAISTSEYEDALGTMEAAAKFFLAFFRDYDAVIAPSAPGTPPAFVEGTGNPIFSTIWTLAGLPCVTVPLLVGENGLPIGVQFIGAAEEDDRLMRTISWVEQQINPTADAREEQD